jgi:GeoRSP system SPASM domain protein
MNLAELTSPIRMYWDIDGPQGIPVDDCRRIAQELVANKLLSLQVTENAAAFTPPCFAILDTLKNAPIALSIVAPISALDHAAIRSIQRSSVKAMFAQANSMSDLDKIALISKQAQGNPLVGIAFPVSTGNFRDLPAALSFCVEQKITHLLLPMQRLRSDEKCFSFSRKEREELTEQLNRIDKPASLKITIHDPFLWRAFFPTVEFPSGGCQAANTMLYISPAADVHPCPIMPIKMGNLLTTSLKDIIFSDRKKEVRQDVLSVPKECERCGELGQCKGGCRGRAYRMTNSLHEADPACT